MKIEPKEITTITTVYMVGEKEFTSQELAQKYIDVKEKHSKVDSVKAKEEFNILCEKLKEFLDQERDELRWDGTTVDRTFILKDTIELVSDYDSDYPNYVYTLYVDMFLSGATNLQIEMAILKNNLKLVHITETLTTFNGESK